MQEYACTCTVKTAKPPQPIEKSTAGANVLAQVTVAKPLDHLPLHRLARTGRIWPYDGDQHHPVILYDYTKPPEPV